MTGGTGSGTVGGNVVQAAFNFGPGGRSMTVATRLTRRIERQVAGTLCNVVGPAGMDGIEAGDMTGLTITRGTLTNRQAHQTTGVDVVTAVTAVVCAGRHTDQGVIMTTGTAGRANRDDGGVIRRR